jgi:hypothetical protein
VPVFGEVVASGCPPIVFGPSPAQAHVRIFGVTTDPPDDKPLGSDEGRPDVDGLFLVRDGEDDAYRCHSAAGGAALARRRP